MNTRLVAAWALVIYAGLHLVFAFFDWVLPGGSFGARSAAAGFSSLVELALPLAGVLLATGAGLASELPATRTIAAVAVTEYAATVGFGALAWLFGLGAPHGVLASLEYLTLVPLRLGLAVLAGLVVRHAWVRLGGSLPWKTTRSR
jgi:hypothetical protein